MKIFLDTADISKIESLANTGLVDGITTNPSIIAKQGRNLKEVISEICKIVKGPISAEVISLETEGMLKEAEDLIKIADNVCIKLPLTQNGLQACKIISSKGVMVNMTLCFSVAQGLMAAKAGATFVSPFVGRWDDIGTDGMDLISNLRLVFNNYGFETEILAASVRHPVHFMQAAQIGADAITIPPELFSKLISHPLTDKGIEIFLKDYNSNK